MKVFTFLTNDSETDHIKWFWNQQDSALYCDIKLYKVPLIAKVILKIWV